MREILVLIFCAAFVLIMVKERKTEKNGKRECRHCGKMIPYAATTCPYCRRNPGIDIGAEARATGRTLKFLVKAFFLMAVVMLVLALIGII